MNGWAFIRRCLHLHWRAVQAGYEVALHALCAGLTYWLSPAQKYRIALGDEPHQMRDATFQEIEDTRMPSAFRLLWEGDKEWYTYVGRRIGVALTAPTDLQTIMRHSTFATTGKYYLKANAIEQAERIATLFEECTQQKVGTVDAEEFQEFAVS